MKKGDKLQINLKMSMMLDISEGLWEVESVLSDSVILRYVGPEAEFQGGDRRARYPTEDIEMFVEKENSL